MAARNLPVPLRVAVVLATGNLLCSLLKNPAFVFSSRHCCSRALWLHSPIQLRQAANYRSFSEAGISDHFAAVQLDEQQQETVEAVLKGHSILITGGAGVGKSATISKIQERLHEKYGEQFFDKVAITASTGIAAVSIGGCTLHCATGIGVPKKVTDFKMKQALHKVAWQNCELLIVDEVSMISGEFFDLLDFEMRCVRDDARPFGGLQLVLVGDFAQLPPICCKPEPAVWSKVDQHIFQETGRAIIPKGKRSHTELYLSRGMLFQSDAFWDLELTVFSLTKTHRSISDPRFSELMQTLRSEEDWGKRKTAIEELNKNCYRNDCKSDGWKPEDGMVALFPTNAMVESTNADAMSGILGKARTFKAKDSVRPIEQVNLTMMETQEKVLKSSQYFKQTSSISAAPSRLTLKEGALVMLIANVDVVGGLVNGATGRVVHVPSKKMSVLVDFANLGEHEVSMHTFQSRLPGIGTCERSQLPLKLAWALTHHKSQGKTLPRVTVNPESFATGQAYVAVSRAQNMKGLTLTRPARVADFKVHPLVPIFNQYLKQGDASRTRAEVGHWRNTDFNGKLKKEANTKALKT